LIDFHPLVIGLLIGAIFSIGWGGRFISVAEATTPEPEWTVYDLPLLSAPQEMSSFVGQVVGLAPESVSAGFVLYDDGTFGYVAVTDGAPSEEVVAGVALVHEARSLDGVNHIFDYVEETVANVEGHRIDLFAEAVAGR
jgi:hypothetical protein